jgi:hypothetical protein
MKDKIPFNTLGNLAYLDGYIGSTIKLVKKGISPEDLIAHLEYLHKAVKLAQTGDSVILGVSK